MNKNNQKTYEISPDEWIINTLLIEQFTKPKVPCCISMRGRHFFVTDNSCIHEKHRRGIPSWDISIERKSRPCQSVPNQAPSAMFLMKVEWQCESFLYDVKTCKFWTDRWIMNKNDQNLVNFSPLSTHFFYLRQKKSTLLNFYAWQTFFCHWQKLHS